MYLEAILILIITVLVVLIAREFLAPAAPVHSSPPQPKKEVELKNITPAELCQYTGSTTDTDAPIYIAVDGDVYDVSKARGMYGPGSAYNIFAGHDASFALATDSLEPDNVDKSIESLSSSEKDRMYEWKMLYDSKYPLVGKLVSSK